MNFKPDEAAVFGALATTRKAVRTDTIAKRLRWLHNKDTSSRHVKNYDKYRVLRALKGLEKKGLVEETLTGVGSRWGISKSTLST